MALDIAYYKRINSEFHRRVGTLNWYEDLEALGFTPDCVIGAFYLSDIPALQQFCLSNSKYHIVTYISSLVMVNRFDKSGRFYFLADGDKDPSIELVFPQEVDDHLAAEFHLLLNRLKPERCF